jgi:hypothetical protein
MKRIISNIKQWEHLTLLVLDRWNKSQKPFSVTIGKPAKTHEQLGYLHSEVLPKFTQAMFEAGEIKRNNERDAKYHLKLLIGYGEWINYKGYKVFDDDSFEAASIDVLNAAIDKAIDECALRGVAIEPPRGNA